MHLEARRDHPYCTGGIVERVERALSPTPHSIVERVGKVLYHNAVSAVTLSLRAKVTRAGPFPCLALPLQLLVSLRCDVTRPACRARHSDEACPSCLPWFVSCACGVTRPVWRLQYDATRLSDAPRCIKPTAVSRDDRGVAKGGDGGVEKGGDGGEEKGGEGGAEK